VSEVAPLRYKIPRSVLVVIHTADLHVLLMERAPWPGFWQSVTGSLDREDEPLVETAVREVAEETGIDATRHVLIDWAVENRYQIMNKWRSRYGPDVTHNSERVFGLRVAAPIPVTLAPREHSQYIWMPHREAAEKCFSWSNRDAILMLPERLRLG
jgi:dihydroneopterin triphosphate diphosphatase